MDPIYPEDIPGQRLLRPSEALAVASGAMPSLPTAADVLDAGIERLAIHVGILHLLLPPDAGREVILPLPATRLPHTPAWLLGIANIRGALVPILDPAAALEVERDDQVPPYMLVLGAGDDAVGFQVDGLPVLRRFEAAERLNGVPPHPRLLAGHVRGGYEHQDAVWMDVDIEGFLGTLARLIGLARS